MVRGEDEYLVPNADVLTPIHGLLLNESTSAFASDPTQP
jgi:hypothetical protein